MGDGIKGSSDSIERRPSLIIDWISDWSHDVCGVCWLFLNCPTLAIGSGEYTFTYLHFFLKEHHQLYEEKVK
jgi:hypothetical protein